MKISILFYRYNALCKEKVFVVEEAVVEDAPEEYHDLEEEARVQAELEKIKLAKDEERRKWALGTKMEFEDWSEEKHGGGEASGLLAAMLRMQNNKIYHTPREGSWWAEDPDVKVSRREKGGRNASMPEAEKRARGEGEMSCLSFPSSRRSAPHGEAMKCTDTVLCSRMR